MSRRYVIVPPPGASPFGTVEAYGPIEEDALDAAIEAEAMRRYGSKTPWPSTNLIGDGYLICELVAGPNGEAPA